MDPIPVIAILIGGLLLTGAALVLVAAWLAKELPVNEGRAAPKAPGHPHRRVG